jgi:hypothetical protein
MTAMTDEEVRAFIAKNEQHSGIKVRNNWTLYYDNPEANALYLKFPETPGEAAHFARLAAMLGAEDESMFYGALLWITLSDIGSPQIEKTGWAQLEMMRRGFGENRPLEVAPGHWFRNGALVELAAFLLPCFVFGWDAYVIPSRGNLFLHISHDEFWTVVTKDEEAHIAVLSQLKGLEPIKNHLDLLRDFCPGSKYIQPA